MTNQNSQPVNLEKLDQPDPTSTSPTVPDSATPNQDQTTQGTQNSQNSEGQASQTGFATDQFAAFEDEAPSDGGVKTGEVMFTQDQFARNFAGVFRVSGWTIKQQTGIDLEALKISHEDEELRAASDCLYDICEETPWLRFLISPDNKWVERAVVLGGFTAGITMKAASEFSSKVQEARAAQSGRAGAADTGEAV